MAKTVVPGPVLIDFRQSRRRWREPSKSPKTHGRPVGTRFKFTLSESATVTFVFSKHVPGRLKKHRCVAPTTRNRHLRACTREVIAGKLKLTAKAGHDKFVFLGKTVRAPQTPAGTYTLTITAVNANSKSARLVGGDVQPHRRPET